MPRRQNRNDGMPRRPTEHDASGHIGPSLAARGNANAPRCVSVDREKAKDASIFAADSKRQRMRLVDFWFKMRPMGELDRMIVRIALRDARRLMSQGCLPDEAAAQATPGAWAAFRLQILMRLLDDALPPARSYSCPCAIGVPMP